MPKPYLVVSDIHLGAVPEGTERAFRDFLRHAAEEASGLLINGDLFDFWFEYRTVIHGRHFRVLAALAEVVEAGVPVSFVGGNHDAWGGAFLRDEVGMELVEGPAVMELAGRRALVAHGDGVGRGDLKYRALRRLIRHPWTIGAFRLLHPDWGSRIADLASSTDVKLAEHDPGAKNRAAFIESWAREQLATDPSLDLVLAGHCHQPLVEEVAPGRFYVNTGDWIRHFTYLRLPAEGGPPELLRWPVAG